MGDAPSQKRVTDAFRGRVRAQLELVQARHQGLAILRALRGWLLGAATLVAEQSAGSRVGFGAVGTKRDDSLLVASSDERLQAHQEACPSVARELDDAFADPDGRRFAPVDGNCCLHGTSKVGEEARLAHFYRKVNPNKDPHANAELYTQRARG